MARCSVQSGGASRTAVFVCQGRAAAEGRLATDRFRDPIARSLLRADEVAVVDRVRANDLPSEWRERMAVEAVRACSEIVVARTVTIDEAVCRAAHSQVVIVGAGLDSRPWRLACLHDAVVYAVDHPSSQADAMRRAAGLPLVVKSLIRVPVDLARAQLDDALASAGHEAGLPTTWVWEGVVPYLPRPAVSATAAAITARSAAGSVLVANYQRRDAVTLWGRRLGRVAARLSRLDDPLADEPWQSLWTPNGIARLLARHGLRVDDDEDLLTIATRIGSPATRRRSLASGRVLTAHR
jgi:methyltransferase (TIGR00027 family)